MRAVLVFFVLALFAMAAAQVNVVDNNPEKVKFVNNNPSDGTAVNFVNNNPSDGTAVNFVDNNPSDGTAVNFVDNNPSDGTAVNFVDNNPSDGTAVHVVDNSNPGQDINLNNPDPFFGQPSNPQGGEPVDISPTFVNPPPYPYKPRDNPFARDGK